MNTENHFDKLIKEWLSNASIDELKKIATPGLIEKIIRYANTTKGDTNGQNPSPHGE
jgi:hypothetical protein